MFLSASPVRTESQEILFIWTPHNPLAGQVAVVTGAGRGIGAAIARKLAALGATAVLCGRTQSTLDATAQHHPRSRRQDGSDSLRRHRAASTGICRRPRRQHVRPPRHPGQQRRHRRLQRRRCTTSSRRVGPDSQHQPARRLLRHSRLRSPDDSRVLRTHHQHLVPRRKKCSAQRSGLCRLEVGIERADATPSRKNFARTTSACPSFARDRWTPN